MIEIKNLVKTFPGNITASNHLNMEIDNGIYGLVGENGAGKSTLFRLIANVIYPDEGEILIDSIPNFEKEAKEKIFYLPDDPYIKPSQTISSVFDFYNTFYSVDKDKFNRLIDSFSLPQNRRINGFSKGMKRQLFIALALSIKTDYLLLDEAFDGLDPLIMEKIKGDVLTSKEERKAIIIASHNINALNQLADRIILLSKGKMTRNGSIEDMSKTLVKYQIATNIPILKEELGRQGFHVISIKKIGSIYHVVINQNDRFENYIKETYHPLIIEEVGLQPDEIITLNMLDSKGETK